MLRFSPVLLALVYGFVIYWFSAFRLRKSLDSQSVELLDPNIQPVLKVLADATGVDRIKVHLYQIEQVNGLAAPDGRIFITNGLYNKYRGGEITAEELATVVAHELGHIALGHARRRMIDFSCQNAVRAVFGMIMGRFLPGFGHWLAGILSNLLISKLSRADEYEADEYASALLIKSGLGIEPQIALFQKLNKLNEQSATSPAWLLSHPKPEDRILAIKKSVANWQNH